MSTKKTSLQGIKMEHKLVPRSLDRSYLSRVSYWNVAVISESSSGVLG